MTNELQGSVALAPRNRGVRSRQLPTHNWIDCIPGLLKATDLACIVLAGALALALHLDSHEDISGRHLAVVILMASLGHVVLRCGGVYTFERIAHWPGRMGHAIAGLTAAGAVLVGVTAMLDVSGSLPYRILVPMTLYAIAGVVLTRAGISALIWRAARAGFLYRRIAIVGNGPQADRLWARMTAHAKPWQRLAGIYADGHAWRVAAEIDRGESLPAELSQAIRRNEIDDVIVALPRHADARLNAILHALRDFPVRVLVASDLSRA